MLCAEDKIKYQPTTTGTCGNPSIFTAICPIFPHNQPCWFLLNYSNNLSNKNSMPTSLLLYVLFPSAPIKTWLISLLWHPAENLIKCVYHNLCTLTGGAAPSVVGQEFTQLKEGGTFLTSPPWLVIGHRVNCLIIWWTVRCGASKIKRSIRVMKSCRC